VTTTPESWEQQLRDAAHTIPDTEGMEAIRHALIDHTIRLYTALGWSVDLDPDDALARAAEMARQLDEARLELTRWQSMFGDVDTARARLDGLEALAAELRRERDEARAYAKHAVKEATAVNRRLVDELERLRAQHDRVRELHPPEEQHDRTWCAHDDHAWPCPTYTALSEPAADTTPDRGVPAVEPVAATLQRVINDLLDGAVFHAPEGIADPNEISHDNRVAAKALREYADRLAKHPALNPTTEES